MILKKFIPISALKKDNIDDLIKTIKKYLDEGERYYSEDYYTDKSINFMVSEIVREKVLNLTHEEVPHAVTCVLEKYEEEKNSIHINVLIIVEKRRNKKNTCRSFWFYDKRNRNRSKKRYRRISR